MGVRATAPKHSRSYGNAITVTGISAVVAQLQELDNKMQRSIYRTALTKAGRIVRKEAKRLAPKHAKPYRVSKGRKQGDLKKSLKLEVRAGLQGYKTAVVRSKDPIGHLIEFGHAVAPRGPGKKRIGFQKRSGKPRAPRYNADRMKKVPGREFLKQGLQTKQAQALDVLYKEIKAGLERAL